MAARVAAVALVLIYPAVIISKGVLMQDSLLDKSDYHDPFLADYFSIWDITVNNGCVAQPIDQIRHAAEVSATLGRLPMSRAQASHAVDELIRKEALLECADHPGCYVTPYKIQQMQRLVDERKN